MLRGWLPLAATLLAGFWATVAVAHDMTITVAVEGDSVVVTLGYEDGSRPAEATVVFTGDDGSELLVMPMASDGTVRIDLSMAQGGIVVEASDENGHSNYRILTPADLGINDAEP